MLTLVVDVVLVVGVKLLRVLEMERSLQRACMGITRLDRFTLVGALKGIMYDAVDMGYSLQINL